MSRIPRSFSDNTVYHILQRGNNRKKMFFDDNDCRCFLGLIKKYSGKYSFDLYHYCFMPNHVHLLLKIIKKEEMSKLFQGIFQSFQFHHRKKYNYCGSLYQGRYKSLIVNDDSYLLECGRYIERNPVRAGFTDSPDKYKWSSYRFYTERMKSDLICQNPLYSDLGKTIQKRRKAYAEYVSVSRPYETLLDEIMSKLSQI